MSRTITVDGTDVTALTRWESWALQMKAHAGEVAAGSIVFDDTTGTADPASPMKEWVVTESDASPTTIAGGFIGERRPARGPLRVAAQRQWEPVLEDYNAAFMDRVLKGTNARRPAESDVERIQWLAATGALDMLDDFDVDTDDPQELEKTSYRGKYPFDVLNDAAENTGKNYFVYYKGGTGWTGFYGPWAQATATFTSDVRISDVLADIDDSVTFGASNISYELDPGRIYAALVIKWKRGWVTVKDDGTVADFRNRQKTVVRENFKSAQRARTWGTKQLTKLNEEVKRLSLSVDVPASALGELRAGQRIEVKLQAHSITAFTYFRIVDATYRPVTDGRYRVDLVMRDKIRPVNIGDIYADPETTVASKGSGSGEPGGDDPGTGDGGTGGGGGVDANDYLLDGYDRSGYPTEVDLRNTQLTTPGVHAIRLGTGATQPYRMLLVFVGGFGDSAASTVAAAIRTGGDFTQVATEAGSNRDFEVMYRILDGTEPWAPVDAELEIDTGAVTPTVQVWAVLLSYGIAVEAVDGTTLDPPSLNPSWATTEKARWYTFVSSDAAMSATDPTGYTNAGASIKTRLSGRNADSTTNDPSTYTSAGATLPATVTVAVRAAGDSIGRLPTQDITGAWWEGDNEYSVFPSSSTIVVDGSVLSITATTNNPSRWTVAVLGSDHVDGPFPMLPHEASDDFTVEARWRITGAVGNTGHAGLRYWYLDWMFAGRIQINLGDGTNDPGIEAIGSSSDALTTALPALDAWGRMKMSWHNGNVRGKVWDEGDTEPDWQVSDTLAAIDPEDLEFDIAGRLGNASGPAMELEIDWLRFSGGAGGGDIVVDRRIDHGTGGLLDVGESYVAGTMIVYVDHIRVTPTSYDPNAGTVQLAASVYHDAGNHPDGCSIVRVTYEKA